MTVDEMREELEKHCSEKEFNCEECVLSKTCKDAIAWKDETEGNIENMYEILKEDSMENKNYMSKVAEMLGVEIGEKLEITDKAGEPFDDSPFMLKEKGLFDVEGCWRDTLLTRLLNGTAIIQKQWKPKDGETYYAPVIHHPNLYFKFSWCNDSIDEHCYKHKIYYKTKEEAIAKAKEMLEAIGE